MAPNKRIERTRQGYEAQEIGDSMSAKCPNCDKPVSHVNLQAMDIYQNYKPQWHGVAYTCPSCNALLSVGMDPTLLRNEIIESVVVELRNG